VKLTIKKKLILAFTATVLLPVAIIGVIAVNSLENLALSDFRNSTQEQVKQVDNGMTLFFQQTGVVLKLASKNYFVQMTDNTLPSYVEKSEDMYIDAKEYGGITTKISNYLGNIISSDVNFADTYVGSRWGGFVAATSSTLPGGYDPTKRP